ncbi:non-hydrolyzing UDP-N-acetylglucosamine 2-epimerase [Emticicia sp. BO119]|uniref:non-hydrolyzing UDP-N-acetylglucosamine 2-epimerase n=1 Tax=Emticicia sp. BO119 TaxID=2757768 RepID=UPI0015F0CE45|nr:UDP-N-acetylglucosamine 2-epimerase (non-hydrolyzing) [Emticicia sp. BO119]MBA4853955.1 UDP-N-acetylglucosamine 2-epimerase (non-hydrolyzing) [Emticicia sp. BO119]
MKIITVVGARPQFIKAAVVSRAFAQYSNIQELIIHTGQHFDSQMSDIFFEEMQIPKPHINLNINGLSHSAMTGQMLEGIENILLQEKPDYMLVYGDTNSTLAGALAAKKLCIPVIHVEAGLRSFEMKMPEEINRIITDRISDILFCPTKIAYENLQREGFNNFPCKIVESGDVMFDAALFYAEHASKKSNIIKYLNINQPFILSTIHRAENTDSIIRLENIVNSLNEISLTCPIILPIHPRTKKIIQRSGLNMNFTVIEPVGYFDMIELLKHCKLVMTDSGGLQKEAYYFQKNCITLRDQTEWKELVDNGYNICVGTNKERILYAFHYMLNTNNYFNTTLYGQGDAGNKIVDFLNNHAL